MAQDPHIALTDQLNPATRRAGEIADIKRRLSALENNSPRMQVTAGALPLTPREGTSVVVTVPQRFWIYVNGGWHYTALT